MILDNSIKYLKGVGPARAELFNKLGIHTVKDLLDFFPRSYMDYTSPVPISQCIIGQNNIIEGKVTAKLMPAFIRKGMTIFKAVLTDYENEITIVIYNNKYLFCHET